MPQMSVSIPDPLKEWCEAQVKTGRYASASDYLRDLIRHDQERNQGKAEVQKMLDDAIASGVSSRSLDEIFALAKQKADEQGLNAR